MICWNFENVCGQMAKVRNNGSIVPPVVEATEPPMPSSSIQAPDPPGSVDKADTLTQLTDIGSPCAVSNCKNTPHGSCPDCGLEVEPWYCLEHHHHSAHKLLPKIYKESTIVLPPTTADHSASNTDEVPQCQCADGCKRPVDLKNSSTYKRCAKFNFCKAYLNSECSQALCMTCESFGDEEIVHEEHVVSQSTPAPLATLHSSSATVVNDPIPLQPEFGELASVVVPGRKDIQEEIHHGDGLTPLSNEGNVAVHPDDVSNDDDEIVEMQQDGFTPPTDKGNEPAVLCKYLQLNSIVSTCVTLPFSCSKFVWLLG
jgi:hypothetical protein